MAEREWTQDERGVGSWREGGGSGDGSLTVTDGATTVTDVTTLSLIGAVTGDGGSGIAEISVPPPSLASVLNEDNNGGGNGISDPGVIDMNGNAIANLADPSSAQEAATKNYVDTSAPAKPLADVLSVGNDANTFNIANLSDPSDPQDAATKAYVDGLVGAPQASTNVTVVQAGGTLVVKAANTFVRWVQIGKLVSAHFTVWFDSGTTGSSSLVVIAFPDLPDARAAYGGAGPTAVTGIGTYWALVAAAPQSGVLIWNVSDPLKITGFSGAVVEDDFVSGTITYEAA